MHVREISFCTLSCTSEQDFNVYIDHKQPCKLPFQGCQQFGRAMSVPPAAILGGLLIITSLILSPAIVKVPQTNWIAPVLVWLTISMPTGNRKTTIYQFLREMIHRVHCAAQCKGQLYSIYQ